MYIGCAPKISVIIPVCNLEDYIARCLNSILSQSLSNIEVICVNDGSTDKSLSILQKYANVDERVVIINQPNLGAGPARNAGIAEAKGKYIMFIDGDDWIENDTLIELAYKADTDNLNVLIFGGLTCYTNEDRIIKLSGRYSSGWIPFKYRKGVFSSEEIKKDLFKFPSTAWSKLYRRDFFIENRIKFQDIEIGEDQIVFVHSMLTSDRTGVILKNYYCHERNRESALTHGKDKFCMSPVYIFGGIERLVLSDSKYSEFGEILAGRYFSKATSWFGRCLQDRKKHIL